MGKGGKPDRLRMPRELNPRSRELKQELTVKTPRSVRGSVLAYIIVAQALGYVIITVWGLLGIWRLQIRPTPE
ncbi:MAG: hypothetical protein NTX53_17305 [candidate division WOR-3 bacterium]|nr:hypothetical protein [candidate division WOR-3 bacterium]